MFELSTGSTILSRPRRVHDIHLQQLQGVFNAAARLIVCRRKYDNIFSTMRDLHWLPIYPRIEFKL